MSEGINDVVLIVPYVDATFGRVTFGVCTVEDLLRNLMDCDEDNMDPDEMYEEGVTGAIQRSAIDGPVGSKPEEVMGFVEKAGISNSAEGRFTYWDREVETE